MLPERDKLRGAAATIDSVGQVVEADERGPGNPSDQGECRRDGGKPGCASHAQQRHAQVTQGQEEGGRDGTDKVQNVAGRASHRAGDERLAAISRPREEVERDRERREDDAGRQAQTLECECGGHRCLLALRCRSFHTRCT